MNGRLPSGVPIALRRQLRRALLDCDEFASDSRLAAVFAVEDLTHWQPDLPNADSRSARVDLTIDYLKDKRLINGKRALVLLLRTLSENHDDPDLHARLIRLADELEWVMQRPSQLDETRWEANPTAAQPIFIAEIEKLLACTRAVARVDVPRYRDGQRVGSMTGTGWLITPRLALTCWHVLEASGRLDPPIGSADLQLQIDNTLLRFDYTSAGNGIEYRISSLEHPTPETKLLDYAVLRLDDRQDRPLNDRGYLRLDLDAPLTTQTSLYIIQHPLGQPQQVAGDAFERSAPTPGGILYKAPSEFGTSGAPVLNRASWNVVGMHKGENETVRLREGVLLRAILDNMQQHRPDLVEEIMHVQR